MIKTAAVIRMVIGMVSKSMVMRELHGADPDQIQIYASRPSATMGLMIDGDRQLLFASASSGQWGDDLGAVTLGSTPSGQWGDGQQCFWSTADGTFCKTSSYLTRPCGKGWWFEMTDLAASRRHRAASGRHEMTTREFRFLLARCGAFRAWLTAVRQRRWRGGRARWRFAAAVRMSCVGLVRGPLTAVRARRCAHTSTSRYVSGQAPDVLYGRRSNRTF
mmetsp:Transcript_18243/g.39185  ORF Transcript_18243/g.39185 Transcript_18243/m.39185 type:complete len:219 (-) Transcript_18243:187-843(-)